MYSFRRHDLAPQGQPNFTSSRTTILALARPACWERCHLTPEQHQRGHDRRSEKKAEELETFDASEDPQQTHRNGSCVAPPISCGLTKWSAKKMPAKPAKTTIIAGPTPSLPSKMR